VRFPWHLLELRHFPYDHFITPRNVPVPRNGPLFFLVRFLDFRAQFFPAEEVSFCPAEDSTRWSPEVGGEVAGQSYGLSFDPQERFSSARHADSLSPSLRAHAFYLMYHLVPRPSRLYTSPIGDAIGRTMLLMSRSEHSLPLADAPARLI